MPAVGRKKKNILALCVPGGGGRGEKDATDLRGSLYGYSAVRFTVNRRKTKTERYFTETLSDSNTLSSSIYYRYNRYFIYIKRLAPFRKAFVNGIVLSIYSATGGGGGEYRKFVVYVDSSL